MATFIGWVVIISLAFVGLKTLIDNYEKNNKNKQ